MQRMRYAEMLALAIGLGIAQPSMLLAAEHGGQELGGAPVATKEHGGTPVATKEHGGSTPAAVTHEGSHGMEMDEGALLREAATALRKGQVRSDLAAKLEQLAEHIAHE